MSKKKTTEQVVVEFRDAHGPMYDYSGVEYEHANKPVLIRCPSHGTEFYQYAAHHRRGMVGCPTCALDKRKETWVTIHGVDNPQKSPTTRRKNKETLVIRYGVEHQSQIPEVKQKIKETCFTKYGPERKDIIEKFKKTCMVRYGVENPQQCHHIHEKSMDTFKKRNKSYTFKGGEVVTVSGYEPKALNKLENMGYSRADIALYKSEGRPTIRYTNELNVESVYFPDIYIPRENRIIEVKSEYTYNLHLDKNKCKQAACIDQGYIFEFWILD